MARIGRLQGQLGKLLQFCIAQHRLAEFGQAYRQAQLCEQGAVPLQFGRGPLFQHQLDQAAERHHLAVQGAGHRRQGGQATQQGVRKREAAAFEGQPAEQHGGLGHRFHRRCGGVAGHILQGRHAVLDDHRMAMFGHHLGNAWRQAAEEIAPAGRGALRGLVALGDGVSDAGPEKAHGRLHDDRGVDEDQIRVARQVVHADQAVRFVIQHDQARGGRIVGGHRRCHHQCGADFACHALGGVDGLAATQGDHQIGLRGARLGRQVGDSGPRAFAGKGEAARFEAGPGQGLWHPIAESGLHHLVTDQHGPAAAHLGGQWAQLGQRARPLDIAARKADHPRGFVRCAHFSPPRQSRAGRRRCTAARH